MKKVNILKNTFMVITFISLFIQIIFLISIFRNKFIFPTFVVWIFPIGFSSLAGWLACLVCKPKDNKKAEIKEIDMNTIDKEEKSA